MLTGAIVISILRNPPTDACYLHITRFENLASDEENNLSKRALNDLPRDFDRIAQLEVVLNHIVAYTIPGISNPFFGGSMDIFWNNTMTKDIARMLYMYNKNSP